MPIYEYRCPDCDQRFERLVPGFSAPTPACPSCGATNGQRLISRLGLAGAPTGSADDLFFSDKLTFTQKQGLKGRVPEVAKQAYKAMRSERIASGKELHHHGPSEEELAEMDPDDPRRLEAGHYHDADHIHLVDDEDGHSHGHDHAHDHDHEHSHADGHEHAHSHHEHASDGPEAGADPAR